MKNFLTHRVKTLLVLSGLLLLCGCTGISRGIAEAVLDRKVEDTRQCQMQGPAFSGLRQSVARHTGAPESGTTKVLIVHGISHHTAGYSNRFRDRLVSALGLDIVDPEVKTIRLSAPDIPLETDGDPPELGTLRVTRHASRDGGKSLLFYELTWSAITEQEKKLILYDTANTEGLGRSGVNHTLKGFMNATVPDLLIYMGGGHDEITASVRESVCWMFSSDWQGLPGSGRHACHSWQDTDVDRVARDDYFFITHSLGSRITLDTIQSFATENKAALPSGRLHNLRNVVREKDFTVFMLANQLPLLQLGRKPPEVTGKYREYCTAQGPLRAQRILRRLDIVAFSDPNDILSYPVQDDFAQEHIDSRICPRLANVSINVAQQRDIFGAMSFADPLTAHNGYLEDPRVIALIINGTETVEGADEPADGKCHWQEVRRIK